MSDESGERMTDEALRAILDAATPGPWRSSTHNAPGDIDRGKVWADLPTAAGGMRCVGESNRHLLIRADQELIAAAPDLAREVLELRAELAQAHADLAAAQDRLTWPRWTHTRDGGVFELRLPSFELLAVVWGAHNDAPAGWRAWHGPVGSGPPCPWEQGAGGIEEAEAYLVQHGRIRPGCTIRPLPE